MSYTYIIIDDFEESALATKATAQGFSELAFVGMAFTLEEGLHLILEQTPDIVFLEIAPADKKSNLSLSFISELHRFLDVLPEIVVTTTKKDWAFEAIDYRVLDYLLKPIASIQILKIVHKLRKRAPLLLPQKENPQVPINTVQPIAVTESLAVHKPLTICIKSYGDYRYINAEDICYFQADNNSTDIYLNSGEMITAFKTLKHFEAVLTFPFIRIHNSYIVNRHYISRIQTGNALCFIKNSPTKLPFSKSYKNNIDLIISEFSLENYIEI